MKNEKSLEAFNRMSVPQAVMKNAIPAMVAQVAAVSLATPVFLMFMAVGTVFGIGGTSVISRAMGEGRTEHAKKSMFFLHVGLRHRGNRNECFIPAFYESASVTDRSK